MFEHLRNFRVIIVTGPQRSGTTICSHMIAYYIGHRHIDEDDYGTDDQPAWRELVITGRQLVIHSPAMARWVHEVANQNTCIVWMLRDLDEILRSQQRIGWNDENERAKYGNQHEPVALTKLRFWNEYQKFVIPHYVEVHYYDLEAHPLWIPEKERKEFGKRQWQLTG